MKELIINGITVKSIWKHDTPCKDNGKGNDTVQYKVRNNRAYSDPTANTAINNILKEERNKKRTKHKTAK